jgi:phosphate transport system substrate-binding protein
VAILASNLTFFKEVFVKIIPFVLFFCGIFSSAWAGLEIKGSGGVSEKPLVQAWMSGYSAAKIKYDSKNKADAINQFLGKGCDFVLMDTPLTEAQTKKAAPHNLLYLPVALSTQAVVYNLPGILSGALKLNPKILSDIFLGKIKKWNDPVLKATNPKLSLPDMDILVVHQSNESSMNDFFPVFLARQNSQWILKREKDKNLHWPVGQNVNGNNKVLDKLRQWAGVIAVVNFSFAQEKGLPVAQLQNEAGRCVEPSLKSIEAVVPDQEGIKAKQNRVKAYPLSAVVTAVVYQDYGKTYHQHDRGQALVDFLNWVLSTEGQNVISKNFFTPLPESVLSQVQNKVKLVQY